MTITQVSPDPGPVIELDGSLDVDAVNQLDEVLHHLPAGSRAGVDLARVRDASAFVLARLGLSLLGAVAAGRQIALLGLTSAQLRLLGHLAHRGVQLISR